MRRGASSPALTTAVSSVALLSTCAVAAGFRPAPCARHCSAGLQKLQLRAARGCFVRAPSSRVPVAARDGRHRLHSAAMPPASTASSPGWAPTTFDVHPASELAELQRAGRDVCTIHLVRHAEGTHNVGRAYRDPAHLDARLTSLGEAQCADLASRCSPEMLSSIELVVTSPLTRCVQTSLLSFPALASDQAVPFVAHEEIRETVNYVCDQRRAISELRVEFPRVDFSLCCHERDPIWEQYVARVGGTADYTTARESAELCAVAERGRRFLCWLKLQPQRVVAVSSHSAFLRCFFSWGQAGGVPHAPDQKLDT